jgi:hypothetical protein
MQACFLAGEKGERLVFTNAIDGTWRPTSPARVPMTAIITLDEHPAGTDYRMVVRHGSPADRAVHADLCFFEGRGSVTEQPAARVESVRG